MKFTPPFRNKITPIKAGIKIIESKIGYDTRTSKLPSIESESIIIINDGIKREIEITDIPIIIFFEICFAKGFK